MTQAAGTIAGVLTDLGEVPRMLPAPAGKLEDIARILDRLSEEIGQAARMLRDQAAQ